jgi:hypothetical protein
MLLQPFLSDETRRALPLRVFAFWRALSFLLEVRTLGRKAGSVCPGAGDERIGGCW